MRGRGSKSAGPYPAMSCWMPASLSTAAFLSAVTVCSLSVSWETSWLLFFRDLAESANPTGHHKFSSTEF